MSSSTSSGQILDDNLSNQINNALESSDSEDDALGEQILSMTRGHEILPDLTESQLHRTIEETNESVVETLKSLVPVFEPLFMAFRGTTKYILNPKPIKKVLHIVYKVVSFVLILLVAILNTLASSWQLTITAIHKCILTTDSTVTKLYSDRKSKDT